MIVDPLYIDISPKLSERIAVFPGDVRFKRTMHLDMSKGDHLGLSSVETTVHVGAHADAPSHYGQGGVGIDSVDLRPYFGLAQVIHVKKDKKERIYPEDIKTESIRAPRVLFGTGSFENPDEWNEDFNSLSPDLIWHLKERGVRLVGIDTPSVDPADSKELESHQMLLKSDMRVLEGIILKTVPAGLYQLIALPLAIAHGDASPVRAILLPKDVDLSRH